MAVAFPRPIGREDFDLIVGVFAALLGTALEQLGEIIDVLPVVVCEGRTSSAASTSSSASATSADTADADTSSSSSAAGGGGGGSDASAAGS